MSLVHNEQTKLTANWFNALAVALIAAGFFAPATALLYGLSQPAISFAFMIALTVGCISLSVSLHLMARAILGRMRE